MAVSRNIPTNWAKTSIGDICTSLQYGYTASASKEPCGPRFLRITDIQDGQVLWPEVPYCEIDNDQAVKYELKAGDIVFARTGGTVGKSYIISSVPEQSVFASYLIRLSTHSDTDSKFLYYFFQSSSYWEQIGLAKGGLQGNVNAKTLSSLTLAIAPIDEQHRIVAKIEELFSELDKGIESLKTAREQLKVYRQALLKHAFEGKLTEQWRKDNADKLETADQLLERIKQEREARYRQQLEDWKAAVKEWEIAGKEGKKPTKPRIAKTSEQLSYEEVAALPSLPDEWKWTKLDDLSSKITDGEHFKPEVTETGVYFLSAKDVRDNGVRFDDPLYVSEQTAQKARQRCNPERDDILIVSRGATVGRMCRVDTDKVFCLLGSVILIKGLPSVNANYLMYALKNPHVNRKIISISGATAQQAVYLRDVKHVAVPICSAQEQGEIAKELDGQMSNIQRMEYELDDNIARCEALRQSILKKAFSGQLVPQNPDDEPASALLERIAKEKEEAATKVKKTKTVKKKAVRLKSA